MAKRDVAFEIIAEAVVDAGLSLDTVVRRRIMLTDISQWEAAARAHGEFFAGIRSLPPSVGTCEMYWLSADSTERQAAEDWHAL